jgi:ribonuclease P protein component
MAVTSDPRAFRASGRWLALVSREQAGVDSEAAVRFGFTAARRHARRAIDRNTVKRVLREAARLRIDELDAAAADRSVDVVLRLRAAAPKVPACKAWKVALREEADGLLAQLAGQLRRSREGR